MTIGYHQFPLPTMPLRIVVGALWVPDTTQATIRATLDVPSDQYSTMIHGSDITARLTPSELGTALSTLADELVGLLEAPPAWPSAVLPGI
jgi:hypothetical protein